MSWIKRLFQRFKNDEDYLIEDENENEYNEQPLLKSQQPQGKNIDARVVYQYPKGQFRFPLIPDEQEQSRERVKQTKKHEQQDKQTIERTVSSTMRSNESVREKNEEAAPKKRGPFRPTEIPSPIYGFERSKVRSKSAVAEPIEYELTNTKMESTNLEEKVDLRKAEELQMQHQMEPVEIQNDSSEEDEFARVVSDHKIEESIQLDEAADEMIEEIEEIIDIKEIEAAEQSPEDLSISIEVIESDQNKEEESVPVSSGRKHLPFNVIMLNQDKKKLVEKMNPYQSAGAHSQTAPQKQELPQRVEEKTFSEEEEIPYYVFPSRGLLTPAVNLEESTEWIQEQEELLNSTLQNFNVHAKVVNTTQGPSVTRYEVQPDPGVKVNKITNLSDDIKLSLAARDIRIEAPIPGKHTIGIEVPNKKMRPVFISEIINSPEFQDSASPLTAVLGLDIAGKPIVTDLRKMPHGLIAGATGSGKSVCINSILVSLLYKATPDEVKLILIDPKMVELAPYNRIPHLVSPVITDVKAATAALKWAVEEMDRRYELFAHAGVRDINRFNELANEHKRYSDKLPFMVIIIDELADLMMMSPADVEEAICRIAQKARACGIHLIIATQRPSVDVITGLIKANVPTRIAFSVSSQIDSRTIIDISGAEKLLGRGDMLFLENGSSKPVRLQGTFVSDHEIDEVVAHVRREREPEYLFEQEELLKKAQVIEEEDELFYDACEFIVAHGSASTSSLQRRFKIGYNRAARLIDMMEQQGMISEARGSKPRDVLITEEDLENLQGTSTIN
ncbi:S-DNA-T family DNA segregation ATPase FtsK/SpoIIIE [Cytobacillus eiseniae]|uniref:S-DNA-T family DNA segregation ATPase FtsK/SpoIIIE n=1 Tax=Cytobacillus eiseniae TaxID=762947 RepID=A0ABS4REY0_9BACI|nr:DNA translocase FtsK [Cytobacillus eiseniae]MBP2241446.1 S-DNA-T family DNA segregation ATPase FtsK/SpoIIIE [Cytobacillus eiseniae]